MPKIVNFIYKRAKKMFFLEPNINYLKWKKPSFHRTHRNVRQVQKAGFSIAVVNKKQGYYAYRRIHVREKGLRLRREGKRERNMVA